MNRAILVTLAILAMAMFSPPASAELGVFEKIEEAVLNSGQEISKLERFTLERRKNFIIGTAVSMTAVENCLTESLSGRIAGTMDNNGGVRLAILWDNAPREEREFSLSYDKETLTPIRGGCFITHENDCVVAGDGDYDRVPNN